MTDPNVTSVFADVQKVAQQYKLRVAECADAPCVRVAMPFPNPNTGGQYFYAGFVRDLDTNIALPCSYFFDAPTNNVYLRLKDYLYQTHRGPAVTLWERFRALCGWKGN